MITTDSRYKIENYNDKSNSMKISNRNIKNKIVKSYQQRIVIDHK